MTVTYTLHGIHFEWDSEKALTNLEKHGVSFETACEVFFDPFVTAIEEQQADGEFREVIPGLTTQWQLLSVVHTMRAGDIFRLISARRATGAERKQYEKQ